MISLFFMDYEEDVITCKKLVFQMTVDLVLERNFSTIHQQHVKGYITNQSILTGRSWMRVAEDRARWRDIGDAYIQQWTVVG
jgi:hypothetical protein